jgi:hypothetical protein
MRRFYSEVVLKNFAWYSSIIGQRAELPGPVVFMQKPEKMH